VSSMPLNPLSKATVGAAGPTGTWRSHRPVVDKDKCTNCLLCWIWCPEGVISKETEIDYEYCKGCGLCARECPIGAITMIGEVDHD